MIVIIYTNIGIYSLILISPAIAALPFPVVLEDQVLTIAHACQK